MRQIQREWWIAAAVVLAVAVHAEAAGDLAPFLQAHRRAVKLINGKSKLDAAKAHGAFAAQHPDNPYAPLASVIQGIILRRDLNKSKEAAAAFALAAKAPEAPISNEFRNAARIWLLRLQMEAIDAALRTYYVDKVEYPKKLDELAKRGQIKPEQLIDPWGDPLEYSTGRLRIAPAIPQQTYSLRSKNAEGDSQQFKRILKESAAFEGRYSIKAITTKRPFKVVLSRIDQPNKALPPASEGAKVGSAKVVRVTHEAVILIDGEFIAICLRRAVL